MQQPRRPHSRITHVAKRSTAAGIALGALGAAVLAAASCDSDETTPVVVTDTTPADYVYTNDVVTSDVAWADPVTGVVTVALIPNQVYTDGGSAFRDAGRTIRDAGRSVADAARSSEGGLGLDASIAAVEDPAGALTALATGNQVCPGHVVVKRKTTPTSCDANDEPGSTSGGVTITFDGCTLAGGGVLDGTLDETSTHETSNTACDSTTTVSVTFETKLTNLSFQAPDGSKVVIPSLTRTGSYERALHALPESLTVESNGRIFRATPDGGIESDRTISSSTNYTFNGSLTKYTSTGSATVDDAVTGQRTEVSTTNLDHDPSCCHPTRGTLTETGSVTWVFGPACGEATRNGVLLALPSCP